MTTPRERLAALPPLSKGAHKHEDEGACVMEAVAYVAGEPWTDRPACACPVISAFMRAWNDDLPTDADRDRLLRPLIPRLARVAGDARGGDVPGVAGGGLVGAHLCADLAGADERSRGSRARPPGPPCAGKCGRCARASLHDYRRLGRCQGRRCQGPGCPASARRSERVRLSPPSASQRDHWTQVLGRSCRSGSTNQRGRGCWPTGLACPR